MTPAELRVVRAAIELNRNRPSLNNSLQEELYGATLALLGDDLDCDHYDDRTNDCEEGP